MTVVFYDIENIFGGVNPKPYRCAQLRALFNRITGDADMGEILEHRAYCSWPRTATKPLQQQMEKLGMTQVKLENSQYGHNNFKIRMNFSDLHIFMDALHLAYTNPAVDCFVFVSCDKDFAVLSERLHSMGKRALWFENGYELPPVAFLPEIQERIKQRETKINEKKYISGLIKKYLEKCNYSQSFPEVLCEVMAGCWQDEIFQEVVKEKGLNISAVYAALKSWNSALSYKSGSIKNMPLAFAKALEQEPLCVCEQNGLFFILCKGHVPADATVVKPVLPAMAQAD